ncbi:hypothetical protein AB4120_01985 [Cupriavidus sp. 2KB_3]|uniref:carboxypeptidase regulatory-like domain-containing protein n=1 Tax=Cupriavidus TaxID=106589 RepID=UPI0011ECF797|nr:carboxypeptidase regulatory-like domain-containing protein [Cupriavidus campinensis]
MNATLKPRRMRGWLGSLCVATLMAACGGDDDGGGGGTGKADPQPAPRQTIALSGQVYQAAGGGDPYGLAADVTVKVFDADGKAMVAQGATSASGDFAALAVPAGKAVVRLSKAGYVEQVVPVNATRDARIEATLLPVGRRIAAPGFQSGGTYTGGDGASVTVAPGSFVTADGKPVSGTVQIDITPYSAAGNPDGFPGTPYLNQAGVDGIMVSMGMADFSFSQNGQPLQLAPGKTARISVPLYAATTPDGKLLRPGDTVPVWSMDDNTGQWRQATGIAGTVIASADSPTGLAMQADVDHFSWWNCDYFRTTRAMRIKVLDEAGAPVSGPAYLTATFTEAPGGYATSGQAVITLDGGVTSVSVPDDAVDGRFSVRVGNLGGGASVNKLQWRATNEVVVRLSGLPQIDLTPGTASLVFFDADKAGGKTIQFALATRNLGTTPLEWLVDGVPGGNPAVGTISASGLYRSPRGANLDAALDAGGRQVLITVRSTADHLVVRQAWVTLEAPSIVIVGRRYGAGGRTSDDLTTYTDDSGLHSLPTYPVHNLHNDAFQAYFGNAGHPLRSVQWELSCGMDINYGVSDCASWAPGASIAADGTLTMPDIPPITPTTDTMDLVVGASYAVPSLWLRATSPDKPGLRGVMRLKVVPVEDPVGDKVDIDLPVGLSTPRVAASGVDVPSGQYVVKDGQLAIRSTAPALDVTAPITWSLVCLTRSGASCPATAWRPTLTPDGRLSGMAGQPGLWSSDYLYVMAQWTAGGVSNRLTRCIVGQGSTACKPLAP